MGGRNGRGLFVFLLAHCILIIPDLICICRYEASLAALGAASPPLLLRIKALRARLLPLPLPPPLPSPSPSPSSAPSSSPSNVDGEEKGGREGGEERVGGEM